MLSNIEHRARKDCTNKCRCGQHRLRVWTATVVLSVVHGDECKRKELKMYLFGLRRATMCLSILVRPDFSILFYHRFGRYRLGKTGTLTRQMACNIIGSSSIIPSLIPSFTLDDAVLELSLASSRDHPSFVSLAVVLSLLAHNGELGL